MKQQHCISSTGQSPKIAKKEKEEKETQTTWLRGTRKQGDDELGLGISVGGDREPPREHIVWVVFGFQTL